MWTSKSLTCASFPSLAGFVTETIFSDSEDRLFTMGLSVWQLKQRDIQSLYAAMLALVTKSKKKLKFQ